VKIRSGFVTNSSSVTYIVAVPDNFTISLIEMNKSFDNGDFDIFIGDTPENRQKILDDILLKIDDLKNGKMVHQDDCNFNESYNILRECLYNNDLVIHGIDSNSDGDSKIIPITIETITKIITTMSMYSGEDIMTNIINKQGK
jgi:hypothetical protein